MELFFNSSVSVLSSLLNVSWCYLVLLSPITCFSGGVLDLGDVENNINLMVAFPTVFCSLLLSESVPMNGTFVHVSSTTAALPTQNCIRPQKMT